VRARRARSRAAGVRLEAGAGIAVSDHDISLTEGASGVQLSASSKSALGGSGPLISAGPWADGVLLRNLSLGIEYLHTNTSSNLDLGLTGAGQAVDLGSRFSLASDSLFANVAWRLNDGFVHPYVGLGLGASRLNANATADVAAPAISAAPLHLVDTGLDVMAPSAQSFIGFDYDLTRSFYVGGAARYYLIDGRLFGVDQVIRQLSAQVKVGLRF
jgi:hypothetical protein